MRKYLAVLLILVVGLIGFQGVIGYRQYQDALKGAQAYLDSLQTTEGLITEDNGRLLLSIPEDIKAELENTLKESKNVAFEIYIDSSSGRLIVSSSNISLWQKLKPNYYDLVILEIAVKLILIVGIIIYLIKGKSSRKYLSEEG